MTEAISLGAEGDLVVQLSSALHRCGLLTGTTSLYDQEVERAVRAFQQERGLSVTGAVDQLTLRRLEEARWKLGDRTLRLQSGGLMRGDDVASLQSRLTELGFNCGRVDGIYGPATADAVKDFQKSAGVAVDGDCGPATVMALLRLMRIVSGGAPQELRAVAARASRGPALAGKIIVLDPVAINQLSDEITFDLARRLEGRLIALGVTVLLDRLPTDQPSEAARIDFSNQHSADLMISLTTDKYPNPTANGLATFYYGNEVHGIHSMVGERFATLIQRELTARTDLLDCRTHAKSWDLLRLTKAPAVIVSFGYLTNPGDLTRLSDLDFREVLVESLVIAIQRLYLPQNEDAQTGQLRVADLRRMGLRR